MISGERGSGSQDFELNIASIIDCFTVLITFMLASASFLSIGLLDAGVAAAGNEGNSTHPPSVNIAIELSRSRALILKVTGKATSTMEIKAKNGQWDYDALTQNLAAIKSKWPDVSAVSLNAENAVEYKEIVKAMEVSKKTLPVVLLGGF